MGVAGCDAIDLNFEKDVGNLLLSRELRRTDSSWRLTTFKNIHMNIWKIYIS
jgi:hypothetical protein